MPADEGVPPRVRRRDAGMIKAAEITSALTLSTDPTAKTSKARLSGVAGSAQF